MDDIIKVLFFLFFLWSLIGPIFSKKEKDQKRERQIPKRPEGKAKRTLPSKKPSNEVLEELFGLKLPSQTESYNYDFEKEDLEKINKPLEDSLTNQQWNIDYDKSSSLENDAKILVEEKPITASPQRNYATDIKRKIKSKSSLKDAIIISEIINKPKSLRR